MKCSGSGRTVLFPAELYVAIMEDIHVVKWLHLYSPKAGCKTKYSVLVLVIQHKKRMHRYLVRCEDALILDALLFGVPVERRDTLIDVTRTVLRRSHAKAQSLNISYSYYYHFDIEQIKQPGTLQDYTIIY